MLILNLKEHLGSGGFGSVFGGLWMNEKVAVKTIKLDKLATDIRDGEMALKSLNHPNVIKLIHVENNEDARTRCYVLERCEASLDKLFLKNGNLKKYCGPMPPKIDVLLQLGNGLEYIHKKKLIHRDIKPENVLIWVGPEENGTPQVLMKWADFGLSKSVNERGSHSVSEIKGTRRWLAPEILKMIGDDVNLAEKRGTIKSDVFAEGLVFGYFLLQGLHPFSSDTLKIELNIRENKPENLKSIKSKGAFGIIKTMLENLPEKRVSSEETVQKLNDLKNKLREKEEKLIHKCIGKKPNLNAIQHDLIQDTCIINVNCKNPLGSTPLLLLLSRNKLFEGNLLETVKLFTVCDADVNYVDREGRNGLHYLCKNYQQEDFIQIIQHFIDNGIDLNCIDNDNQTALDLLNQFNANHRSVDEARQLLSNGDAEKMDE